MHMRLNPTEIGTIGFIATDENGYPLWKLCFKNCTSIGNFLAIKIN